FSSRRRHTSFSRDWSSDVCSSDLLDALFMYIALTRLTRHLALCLMPCLARIVCPFRQRRLICLVIGTLGLLIAQHFYAQHFATQDRKSVVQGKSVERRGGVSHDIR